MEKPKICANINRFNELVNKIYDIMQNNAERRLNPLGQDLSDEAKKRLKWMYIIHFECRDKVVKASRRIGISRQWLSKIHSIWIKAKKNPCSLEPGLKAPHNTSTHNRIDKKIEDKIVEIRKEHFWGKDKIMTVLDRDHKIQVGASTINRYLDKHGLIDVKISNRLKVAHKNKKVKQKQKFRPPKELKDYKPCALIEKDMKFIMKGGTMRNPLKPKAKENFWYQHTVIDSFTRIRTLGLTQNSESKTAVVVQEECVPRLPFKIACSNTDNGSENAGDFDRYLKQNNIIHFYSRSGTPTDNLRVKRSHLTNEVEFYQHGGISDNYEKQKQKTLDNEYIYNHVRPH